jgi:hypothetical protein
MKHQILLFQKIWIFWRGWTERKVYNMKLNKRVLCGGAGLCMTWYVWKESALIRLCNLGQLDNYRLHDTTWSAVGATKLTVKGKDKLRARGSPWNQWRCVSSQIYLSNKLTPWTRVGLGKLTVPQLVQPFPSIMRSENSLACSEGYAVTLSSQLRLGLQRDLIRSGLPTKILKHLSCPFPTKKCEIPRQFYDLDLIIL